MSQPAPLPPGFIEEMSRIFPQDTLTRITAALDTDSPVSVRLNARKPMAAPPDRAVGPVPWCADGLYLDGRPIFTLMPEMHAGAFYVQEAASMIHQLIAGRLCEGRPARLLDLCAAPGGKTTAMLNALPDGSVAVANEQSPQRASALAENLAKYGYPDTIVTCGDARLFGAMQDEFDILAADAPCSGEGMMRKEEVARTQWTPGLVESCARLQGEILEKALPALRPGGFLIYSTCTFNTLENEQISRRLIERHGLTPVSPVTSEEAEAWGLHPALPLPDGTAGHGWRFLPGLTRSEGLYVAVFRKPENPGDDTLHIGAFEHARPSRGPLSGSAPKKTAKGAKGTARRDTDFSECRGWVRDGGSLVWEQTGDSVRAMSPDTAELLSHLPRGVKVISAGVEVAAAKGGSPMPSPALALSLLLAPGAFPEVEADKETALRFLRRESLTLPAGTPKGYVLIRYAGLPLGWVKNLGTRANNLWPAPWRIRMQ